MFKNYRSLWLLLAAALLIFIGIEVFGPFNIGAHEMKTARIVQTLTAERATPADSIRAVTAADSAAVKATVVIEPDTASKTILFIGDSMLEGLSPRLAAYAAENGHTLYTVIWYSSTSEVWGRSGKLAKYIAQLHPDYVFICLGANELFVKDIKDKRDKYVKQMVSEIGDIPFVWIGPPNWKDDTGINDLIKANVPRGSYFRSNGMHFDRAKDGAHPTRSSAILWMDSVARWMPQNSNHPIKMALPDQKTGRPKKIFVHQPNEQ